MTDLKQQAVPAERIVQSQLGAPIDELFQHFDRQPVATASMAHVHRAAAIGGRTAPRQ
jgi:ubiquinone biosynthesis protein